MLWQVMKRLIAKAPPKAVYEYELRYTGLNGATAAAYGKKMGYSAVSHLS
jgi:hypothetical protein